MIVVDGRTDEEKLLELLATGAEETCLDFKATLDLSSGSSKDTLEFIKDAISMGNLADGGYIVVGVDDQGKPAHAHPAVVPAQFDSANIRSKIAKYVEAPVQPVSQPHVVDTRDVVLIYVPPNPDGLPVPTSHMGQYVKPNQKMETVFAQGDVLIREGTSNVRLRYSHWNGLLAKYREDVKAEARRDSDELIRRFVQALSEGGNGGGGTRVPIDLAMDDVTLSEALISTFEIPNTVRIQQFLNVAAEAASVGTTDERATRMHALERIAIVACQATLYDRPDIYGLAVDALERAYKARGYPGDAVTLVGSDAQTARHLLDVLLRVFAVGALIVRQQKWDYLPTLGNRPVRVSENYGYASWLRHGSVAAARANHLQGANGEARGGQMISLARSLIADKPALRPDFGADATLPPAESLAPNDWLLNSLCQFDLWWCILARASGEGTSRVSFFPSCAALHQYRSQPTLDLIVSSEPVRRETFGNTSDAAIASAIQDVIEVAETQSQNFGGWWAGLEENPTVAEFVRVHSGG